MNGTRGCGPVDDLERLRGTQGAVGRTSCFMSRMRASRGQHLRLLYPTMFSLLGSGCSVRYRWIRSCIPPPCTNNGCTGGGEIYVLIERDVSRGRCQRDVSTQLQKEQAHGLAFAAAGRRHVDEETMRMLVRIRAEGAPCCRRH